MLRFFIILFLLSGCGFVPMHSTFYEESLSQIEIKPISSIAGAELYHSLHSFFRSSKDTKYLLHIKIIASGYPIAIDKSSDMLRESVNQNISYQLIDKTSSKVLTSGQFNNCSSYSTNFSPYANYVEKEKSSEILTKYAAEEIRTRLILYFKQKAN